MDSDEPPDQIAAVTTEARLRGHWPDVSELVTIELDRYLATANRPEVRAAVTRCDPWTGDRLTVHLIETFRRFSTMLIQSRSGDFSRPFEPAELSAENLRAVERFEADQPDQPEQADQADQPAELRAVVEQFLALATNPDELMAHQFGPIPVGLQATFGLAELALHHDDLLAAVGGRYRPGAETAKRIAASYEAVLEIKGLVDSGDPWAALLAISQRSDPLDWERLGQRYGEDLNLFKTRFDEMRHPQSGRTFDRLILESVDWVNCVAIDTEGRHVMVRQFRFGAGATTLETPGGMVDDGEDSETAIRRELEEETGYSGGRWRYLGSVQPNPAFHDNRCHHWLATGVEPTGQQDQGPGEHIEVELLTADQVIAATQSGEISHALALSVLARVLDIWAPLRLDAE